MFGTTSKSNHFFNNSHIDTFGSFFIIFSSNESPYRTERKTSSFPGRTKKGRSLEPIVKEPSTWVMVDGLKALISIVSNQWAFTLMWGSWRNAVEMLPHNKRPRIEVYNMLYFETITLILSLLLSGNKAHHTNKNK